ncbi:hypothetical protein PQX77_000825 [Marasmius sp. AFHP31]|nr:hypothetical protein PQX77_000825 [Marasmius sp. AFHP31]
MTKDFDYKTSLEKYRTMASWFLGPRGENYGLMMEKSAKIIANICASRDRYFSDDPRFIDSKYMIGSQDFDDGVDAIDAALKDVLRGLGEHSVPFFSPRYAGHMSFDVSLPAILGYFAAIVYNQNNVTPEASPFSSYVEWKVGKRLCEMLGFNIQSDPLPEGETTVGWGHITCGGSIANLEAMWVARNLKYYPLSLYNAMKPGGPLAFVANTFTTTLCTGKEKNFFSCSPWELLNLTPTEVVSLPERLSSKYGISQSKLDRILDPYSVQTVGKDKLDQDQIERGFEMKPPQIMLSRSNHYSWPKGGAILGIGKVNILELRVDENARVDIKHLREELEGHLKRQHPVYAVVAIIGTTEHGSVDCLEDIIALRDEMQREGLSFMVHADAAWGGYFASKKQLFELYEPPVERWAFSIPLSKYTNDQMLKLKETDSVTIDPHKSGYCAYPAGALCYRDQRMRYLTTWTSPYISTNKGDDIAMGIYGVEGSKPGAAPVGVWMSLEVLKNEGYAHLLGVAMLTGTKMYANWATMTLDSDSLIVMPFNQLPSETEEGSTPEKVRKERIRIRDKIARQPNAELEQDQETLHFMRTLGSDLMINAFACNFHIDGKPNKDTVEASFLSRRLYKRLSMTSMEDDINDKPIIIMATEFSQKKYGDGLKTFKRRLELDAEDGEDLYALSNVSMSPWPTANEFLTTIIEAFRDVAEEEIKTCLVRVTDQPSMHSFVIYGHETLFFVYIASFNVESYRRQVIVKATPSDSTTLFKLQEERKKNPNAIFTFHSGLTILKDLVKLKLWTGDIYKGLPKIYGKDVFLSNVTFDIETIVVDRSLRRTDLDKAYPGQMPFYVFGTQNEVHIDHVLLHGPNAHLSAGQVKLDLDQPLPELSQKPLYLTLDEQFEEMMQPFDAGHQPDFFKPGATLKVSVYDGDRPPTESSAAVARGTVTLPAEAGKLFVDYTVLNLPAASEIFISPRPSSTLSSKRFVPDIDTVTSEIVQMFAGQNITWDDNVARAIARKYTDYEAWLGSKAQAASAGSETEGRILSRFMGPEAGVAAKGIVEKLGLTLGSAKIQA